MAQKAGNPVALRGYAMSDGLPKELFAPLGIAYSRVVLAGKTALRASGEHGNVADTVVMAEQREEKKVHLIFAFAIGQCELREARR